MKQGLLRCIAHNIADSLASGIGLLIGLCHTDVYGEAGRSSEEFMNVDFLTGTTISGRPFALLAKSIRCYRDALPDL
ncbi:hypothetical protein [Spirosoma gilvum]